MREWSENKDAVRKLIARAWADPGFKQELIEDPEAKLNEAGISHDGLRKWRVFEGDEPPVSNSEVAYFFLPNPPCEGGRSEEELLRLASGPGVTSIAQCKTNMDTCCCDITVAPKLF